MPSSLNAHIASCKASAIFLFLSCDTFTIMPYTDVEFIQIHRKKQRFCKKTHRSLPYFTLCIRKKTLQSLRGKHLLLIGEDIGPTALKQAKLQCKDDAAATDQSHICHHGITELSESETENEQRSPIPKGKLGYLKKSVARQDGSENTS
jgi:hypothetical protein